jgi:uncharacterized protein (DUF2345 family)
MSNEDQKPRGVGAFMSPRNFSWNASAGIAVNGVPVSQPNFQTNTQITVNLSPEGAITFTTGDVVSLNGLMGDVSLVAGSNVTVTNSGNSIIIAAANHAPLLETNGAPNGSQSLLNLAAGQNMTLSDNGSGTITLSSTALGGTVFSVGLSMPNIFSVSGSPVTSVGVLGVSLESQTANAFWSGPVSGAASAPTFRAISILDLFGADGSTETRFLSEAGSWLTPATGSSGVTSLNSLTGGLSITAGSNITVTPSGNTIEIAASGGSGVSSLNSLTGALSITAGANITVTPSGSSVEISAAGGGSSYYQTIEQAGSSKPQEAALNFLAPITATDNSGNGSTDIAVPVFVASGAGHAKGLVPDPGASAGSTKYLREDASWDVPPGSGTVTSVAMTVPSILNISGSPITTNGTLAVSLANQLANTFLAGATSGTTAPTFRVISIVDLFGADGSTTTKFLSEAGTWLVPLAVSLETNGTPNGSQTLLNLAAGTNMTLTDNGSGTVTFASTATNGVESLNSLTGTLSITAGSNITVTPSGSSIEISATGGSGSAVGTNVWDNRYPPNTNTPAFKNFSLAWLLPASFLKNACNSWRFGFSFCDGTASVSIGQMQVVQCTAGTTSVISTTAVTIGGSSTPTLTGTNSFQQFTDTISLAVSNAYDYYFMLYFNNSGTVNMPDSATASSADTEAMAYASVDASGNQLTTWAATIPSGIATSSTIYGDPIAVVVS